MIRSYEDLLRTADAYADSRTLVTGVELDVFTILGKRALTAKDVARKAKATVEGTELLLNAFVGINLLAKRGDRFRNTTLSRTYLDASSPKSITNFMWLAGQHWEDWMGLTKMLKKGRPSGVEGPPDDPVFRKRFAKALHERSFYLTPTLIRPLRLDGAKTLLDLGGGAGSYAFALIKKTRGLHTTIFDRPETVRVAASEAKTLGLSNRVDVIAGDLFADDYGGPYDVVFYSNVVHIYGPKDNLDILRKVRRALKPGGRLIIVEYFLENDRAHPADASSFALMMYLFTESGRCYTWDDVTGWLRSVGFAKFRRTRVTEKIGILEAS